MRVITLSRAGNILLVEDPIVMHIFVFVLLLCLPLCAGVFFYGFFFFMFFRIRV